MVEMYHMKTQDEVKENIIKTFMDPSSHLHVVLCSASFSMGLNLRSLDYVSAAAGGALPPLPTSEGPTTLAAVLGMSRNLLGIERGQPSPAPPAAAPERALAATPAEMQEYQDALWALYSGSIKIY